MSSSSSKNKNGDLKIPYEEIVSATNNFSDENFIRRGGFGKVYKGQLHRSGQPIDIVARRLDPEYRQGKKEFLMEVSLLSALKHENLVSMIGYCDEKGEKIIINKHETHESLDQYLADPTLTWMRRLEICVGVARALSYIHYDKGRNFSVIHRNIKSSKILLDDNWKPKLSGFELSMNNTTARRHRLLIDSLSGTIGYMDPTYEKTGGVTHKSDVYSFGVVLFEVLCGRRAFNNPEWFTTQLENQDLKEESLDVMANTDMMIDHEGHSPELAKALSTECSRDIAGNAVVLVEQKDPPSSSILPHMGQPPNFSSSEMLLAPSLSSSGTFSHTISFGSLPGRNPSNSSSERIRPPSFGNLLVDKQPSSSNLVQSPASSIFIDQEEESNVYAQQRLPLALNPLDMCMFTLAPSARFHYEQRFGHLCIPAEELLAPLAKSHYEEEKLYDLIDPDLWKQMDPLSFNVFSKIAYDCLKEQRAERPNIDQVVIRLQEALSLQRKHEQPVVLNEHSQVATEVIGTSTNSLKWENFEHLRISYHDIEGATRKFSQKYSIGSGGYGKVYKAELEYFDSKNSSETEGENLCDLPKIRSTVAIKCLFKRNDTQAEDGFSAEIQTLTSCKHPNIVSLLGFCDEGSDLILVYEYISNGSLDDRLRSFDKMTYLKWEQRLQICLDIAQGLNYLHTEKNTIHRDIKSDNILLDNNLVAKIADFGLSKIRPMSQQATYLETHVAGTVFYLDPEYKNTGKLRKASDIYSLGVVLFEILSGRLAYDQAYMNENVKGLAPFARQHFQINGTLKDMLDPKLKEKFDANTFTWREGPNQDSLQTFLDIAYLCLAETQAHRPKIGTVVEELQNALQLQKNENDKLQFSLDDMKFSPEDIKLATNNFSIKNRIGRGGYGRVFKGEITNPNGRHTNIAAKQLDITGGQGETEFLTELEILLEHKHENVIGLVGYCNEPGAKIIVYEYAPKGSLDRHLGNVDLTWRKRLEICIDIARGLVFLHGGGLTQFLHGGGPTPEVVMHRDIKSSNILLTDDWKAKISDFGLSLINSINEYMLDNACGTNGYCDPQYLKDGVFTKESDIYSFGVVLFEVLCGRLMFEDINGDFKILINTFKRYYRQGKLDDMVFKGIKEHIAPNSLTTFQVLANECVHDLQQDRPTTGDVLLRLEQALEFQVDYETWEPKLPDGYEKIIQMSNPLRDCSIEKKKDLYDELVKGILLQEGNVLFTLGIYGERNLMISARTVSYINHTLHRWCSTPRSSFQEIVEMLDILNLNVKIKLRTQLLSPNVVYGIYLVFRFCEPRKVSSKPLYVNLKYKTDSKTSHAYFATWRDNEWMMIELYRFVNDKEDIVFKFLLESFSRYYCRDSTIYIEGIEFRAITQVKDDEIGELKKVQSDKKMDLLQQLPTNHEDILVRIENEDGGEKLFSLNEVNGKKHLMLSAKATLNNYRNVKLFKTTPSTLSRFPEMIELLPQEVFCISCKIKSQMLSPDTEYACYLVFKLSKKYHGLHGPVKVQDLHHLSDEEVGIVYFRSPSPWNLHDTNQAPKQRADGWMEVKIWKLNLNHELKDDHFHVNLRLISYEGVMAGLIVSGVEFRPM